MAIASGYEHSNFKNVVYEVAIESIYGKDFWAWREEQNFGVGTIFNHGRAPRNPPQGILAPEG